MPPKRRRRVRRARRAVLIAAQPVAAGRRRTVRRRRRRVAGGNIFRKIWSGLKSGFNYARRNQLISKGLALIPHPTAQKAAAVARVAGMGARGGTKRLGNHILVY